MNKNIVVTGGFGFIGSNFVNNHREEFDRMLIIDKMTYAASKDNVREECWPDSFFEMDISEILDVEFSSALVRAGIPEEEPIVLVNFAAESHVDNSIKNSNVFVQSNVEGTRNLLNIMKGRKNPDDKFIQISTDEVYGSIKHFSATELDQLKPNNPYSASKASADMFVRAYSKTFGLFTCITRCCNNYGPNQASEKFVPVVIQSMMQGKNIPVYGDGLNRREWIHVSDHCKGIMKVIEEGRSGEIYNIGTSEEKANLEVIHSIAHVMESITKKSSGYIDLIEFVEDRLGHDLRYSLDCNKIRKIMDWAPEYDFASGIRATVQHYVEKNAP